MENKNQHTDLGIASIIFGVLGIISYFIGLFFYSFVDNRLYGMVAGFILGIIALTIGHLAKKHGDDYGTY